ncbi:hypothetical protein MSAN_01726600 [Mycena sanguinolenta]|uniref:Uncharacterized protein n=1 Tax=Mycena sanguinolenta TaxID=230812 RepID=A0A8H6XW87_9AGAR|nr:hypothetical protein MSAN_01726600 [Mycena sanguinolenta]
MVAASPMYRVGWTMKKFNATMINDIWPETAFFTLIATAVAIITESNIHNLAVGSSLLTVLGTGLGLVISFRTSSAYERYQEGRKMWSNIAIASRNIAQIIWIHVPLERTDKDNNRLTTIQSVIEKKSMINLVQGFSVAVKHFLRGEIGIYSEDLYPLICWLPCYANATGPKTAADMHEEHTLHTDSMDPEKALTTIQSHRPLKPARNPPPASLLDCFPFLRIFAIFTRCCRRKRKHVRRDALGRKIESSITESSVPLEITIYLNSYLAYLLRNGWLQPALATGLVNNIASLQDALSNLDRIGTTPLPFAYQAHLRMSLWLYLLVLPFQIVSTMGYMTIPGTALASFLLCGFLEIGQEIENPFEYNENDLNMDEFCCAIQRELHEVAAYTMLDPAAFVFTSWNQPFAPADRRNAEELTRMPEEYRHADHPDVDPGMASIQRTLLKNWRDVDLITRQQSII